MGPTQNSNGTNPGQPQQIQAADTNAIARHEAPWKRDQQRALRELQASTALSPRSTPAGVPYPTQTVRSGVFYQQPTSALSVPLGSSYGTNPGQSQPVSYPTQMAQLGGLYHGQPTSAPSALSGSGYGANPGQSQPPPRWRQTPQLRGFRAPPTPSSSAPFESSYGTNPDQFRSVSNRTQTPRFRGLQHHAQPVPNPSAPSESGYGTNPGQSQPSQPPGYQSTPPIPPVNFPPYLVNFPTAGSRHHSQPQTALPPPLPAALASIDISQYSAIPLFDDATANSTARSQREVSLPQPSSQTPSTVSQQSIDALADRALYDITACSTHPPQPEAALSLQPPLALPVVSQTSVYDLANQVFDTTAGSRHPPPPQSAPPRPPHAAPASLIDLTEDTADSAPNVTTADSRHPSQPETTPPPSPSFAPVPPADITQCLADLAPDDATADSTPSPPWEPSYEDLSAMLPPLDFDLDPDFDPFVPFTLRRDPAPPQRHPGLREGCAGHETLTFDSSPDISDSSFAGPGGHRNLFPGLTAILPGLVAQHEQPNVHQLKRERERGILWGEGMPPPISRVDSRLSKRRRK